MWFCSLLTVPSGGSMELEPFWRFILRIVFRTGLVELLVLLPKGNGKTTVLAALAVFHLLVTPNAQAFVVAADVEQADELYRCAQHFIECPDHSLDAYLLVRASTRRIRSRRDQGFLRVLASDKTREGGKKHSYNPTLAIIEELHAHENANAYVAMRSAAFKRGALVLDISTAGWDQESTLGKLRTEFLAVEAQGGSVRCGLRVDGRARAVRSTAGRLTVAESRSGRNVMVEWACRDGKDGGPADDLADMRVVKRANPSRLVSLESLQDAFEAPGIAPWEFARYRAGVWTLGFESWLPPGAWGALARDGVVLERGRRTFAAVDMGRYRDTAAVVAVQDRGDEPAVVHRVYTRRGAWDDPVPYAEIKAAIRGLHDMLGGDLEVVFDPRYFDQAGEELEGEGVAIVPFPQSNERMCPASGDLREDILKGRLCHDGDAVLTAHVAAGIAKDVGPDAWKLVKARNGPPVDAVIALAMANRQRRTAPAPRTGPVFEVLA